MKQLTIFHFLQNEDDEIYNSLINLKCDSEQIWSFGKVLRNERGLYEFKNDSVEKVFTRLVDIYFYIMEGDYEHGIS